MYGIRLTEMVVLNGSRRVRATLYRQTFYDPERGRIIDRYAAISGNQAAYDYSSGSAALLKVLEQRGLSKEQLESSSSI